MKARKRFVVIAYDITKTRTRNRVVKKVLKYGGRINLSVFECMLTASQLEKLLCMDCFAGIVYQPERKRKETISSTTVV